MNARLRANLRMVPGAELQGKRVAKKQLTPGQEDDDSGDDEVHVEGADAPQQQQQSGEQRQFRRIKIPERLQGKIMTHPLPTQVPKVSTAFGCIAAARPAPTAPKLQSGGLFQKVTPPSPTTRPLSAPASPKHMSLDATRDAPPASGSSAAPLAPNPFSFSFSKPAAPPSGNPFSFGAKAFGSGAAQQRSPTAAAAVEASTAAAQQAAKEKPKVPFPFGFKANTGEGDAFAAARQSLQSARGGFGAGSSVAAAASGATGTTAAPASAAAAPAVVVSSIRPAEPAVRPFSASAAPVSLVTGEEGEQTVLEETVKLGHFTNGEWADRGAGVLKLNVRDGRRARLIMRSLATKSAMLNAPLDATFRLVKKAERNFIFATTFMEPDTNKIVTETFSIVAKSAQTGAAQIASIIAAIESRLPAPQA